MKKFKSFFAVLMLLLFTFVSGCSQQKASTSATTSGFESQQFDTSSVLQSKQTFSPVGNGHATSITEFGIPQYEGNPYAVINNNIPNFSSDELTTVDYEKYSELDAFGRVGVAIASVSNKSVLKSDAEKTIASSIKPTGWQQAEYNGIPDNQLYICRRLIDYRLSSKNDNEQNLITVTKYFVTDGLLPFENKIAEYINKTDNHVAYRITPVFEGSNMLASGVQIEAYSVEDSGNGICFNVYCFNVQPNISIDYSTGKSSQPENNTSSENPSPKAPSQNSSKTLTVDTSENSDKTGDLVWVPTNGGKKYHSKSSCSGMIDPVQVTKAQAEGDGYTPCKRCY